MLLSEPVHSLISEIHRLFDLAEQEHSLCSQLSRELVSPVINELRYAGQHLLRALSGNCPDENKKIDELKKAESHCKRALYDARDTECMYLIGEALQFIIDYKSVDVSDILKTEPLGVADAYEVRREISVIARDISSIRHMENNDAMREQGYALLGQRRDWLRSFINLLDSKSDLLTKRKRQAGRKFFLEIMGVLLSSAGVLLGIMAFPESCQSVAKAIFQY